MPFTPAAIRAMEQAALEHADRERDEEPFHAALDAKPDDSTLRLVFADWLEERGDPRAQGYRALGLLGKWPENYGDEWDYWGLAHDDPAHNLGAWWVRGMAYQEGYYGRPHGGRQREDDYAALKWSKLTTDQQAEIFAAHGLELPEGVLTQKEAIA
jgi:uncharacterized protein (TIGR02996 family)